MLQPRLIVPPSGPVTAHSIRLLPDERLMPSLKQAVSIILARSGCQSAFIITAVGSLQNATIRLANASRIDGDGTAGNDIKTYNQRFEVVSLVGTFSANDGCHVHISLSDFEGNTIGGHLIDGTIFTTCEIVLGTADGVKFSREIDYSTGYNELKVTQLLPKRQSHLRNVIPPAILLLVAAGIMGGRLKAR
jgi:predicted DNA-binding protein with PD1-like motif